MRAVDLIARKRDGGELASAEIDWLIRSFTNGIVGDEQMSAFAMAVYFRSMSGAELSALVRAMMASGTVIDLSRIPGVKVDKHSTGGIGDKVSIALAPLVAACGVPVPMISGRALGHTGGTLDKLAAIPGFRTDLDDTRFVELVAKHQLALIGQTATLVPADRKLYALRDVTATVPSIPLIAASIMSKKLAEGIDGLVLDVKCGSGAFMKNLTEARSLARTMITIGERMNREVRALVTNMNQMLGRTCGNAVETWEAIDVLKGAGPADLVELTIELGAEMLVLGKVADSIEDGRLRIRRAISDGRGLEKLRHIVEAQEGDPRALDERERMPVARYVDELCADRGGFVRGFDGESIGHAAMILGAGRHRAADPIDLSAGLEMHVRLGDAVRVGDRLASLFHNDAGKCESARQRLAKAIVVDEVASEPEPLVYERLPHARNGGGK